MNEVFSARSAVFLSDLRGKNLLNAEIAEKIRRGRRGKTEARVRNRLTTLIPHGLRHAAAAE